MQDHDDYTVDEEQLQDKKQVNIALSSYSSVPLENVPRSRFRDATSTVRNASALIIAASEKAGMQSIDRERIHAIILRESENSSYLKQQMKRDKQVDVRIAEMKKVFEEYIQNRRSLSSTSITSSTSLSSSSLSSSTMNMKAVDWKSDIEDRIVQSQLNQMIASRDTLSLCVVLDMDAFFYACEAQSRPELNDVPACVGTDVILTSNYCARKYGVRSALAGWIGDKLVEELSDGRETLVHLPSNFTLYEEKGKIMRRVVQEYDPKMRSYSFDEAYIHLGQYIALRVGQGWEHEKILQFWTQQRINVPSDHESDDDHDDSNSKRLCHENRYEDLSTICPQKLLLLTSEIVSELRRKVYDATNGLTCSAGLASNFMIAKIASDRNKPDGQCAVSPKHEDIIRFVNDLPVRKIPGIGRVTEKMLQSFQIHTVQDLYEQRAMIHVIFKPATARHLLEASIGWSNSSRLISLEEENNHTINRKGISRERTFQGNNWTDICRELEEIAKALSEDMICEGLLARTMTLKVKLHTFDVISKSKSLDTGAYFKEATDFLPTALQLLSELKHDHYQNGGKHFLVRLVGIRFSNFTDEKDSIQAMQKGLQSFLTKIPQKDQNNKTHSNVPLTKQLNPSKRKTIKDWVLQESPQQTVKDRAVCPICFKTLVDNSNALINAHIDSCLSVSTLKEVVRFDGLEKNKRKKIINESTIHRFFGRSGLAE